MYKNRLQELCQKRSWELPEYFTTKDGPDHKPRFKAAVKVNGQVFETPVECRSSKEAQTTAARIAFDHFNPLSPTAFIPLPAPAAVNFNGVRLDDPLSRVASFGPTAGNHPPAPAAFNSQFDGVRPDATLHIAPLVAPVAFNHPHGAAVNLKLDGVEPDAALHIVSSVGQLPEMQPVVSVPNLLPLSPMPSSLPVPTPGLLATTNDANTKSAYKEVVEENRDDSTQTSTVYKREVGSRDMLHMYKNQLQQYAQKENLGFPAYTSEAEGPPHARRFKSRVSLNGRSFETLEFFNTLKEAEQAAAKVACQVLSVGVIQEEAGLYKNLLQELAQKKELLCPSYETVSSGMAHKPTFVSNVMVGTHTFRGGEAKTKKQAEINAAKVAYDALIEGSPAAGSSTERFSESPIAGNLSQNIQPTTIIKEHQDTGDEETQPLPKRAKFSSENTHMNTHPQYHLDSNSPSNGSSLLHSQTKYSTSVGPVNVQKLEDQPSHLQNPLVFPCESKLSTPECASVMPYSDDQWAACRVEVDKEPTT